MQRVLICLAVVALSVAVALRPEGSVPIPALSGVPHTNYRCVEPFCSRVSNSMRGSVFEKSTPGLAGAAINSTTGPELFVGTAGRYTYNDWEAEITNETMFDMASCTKVMAATTATAMLYQAGYIGLEDRIATSKYLGPEFAAKGKGEIKIRNLLLHNAGYPPDPNPGYSSPLFPCPQNKNYHPGQDFSCDQIILDNLVHNQTLINPTGEVFVYSDLSMITLMFAVGKIVQTHKLVPAEKFVAPCLDTENLICNYGAYVANNIFQRYDMKSSMYIPDNALRTAPEWYDPWYHHGQIVGFVSDQNAYAMGGISGHAGLFSTVEDAIKLMKVWMFNTDSERLNSTTVKLFTTVANLTQSSRALGWDTNDQAYRWCGTLSNKTFLHIGFTGTQLCGDPELGVFTVLLANARYPDYHKDGMITYRPIFNTLIHDLVKGWH